MYGMVNDSIRLLVLDKFGGPTWKSICDKAGSPELFAPFKTYDDAITYDLVGACVEVLDMPGEVVLRTFGHYWVEHVAVANYPDIMDKTGTDFVAFVKNLDHLHARIQRIFRGYEPPSFRILELGSGQLQVDYYSHREGLLPFVVGLMEGLGDFFETDINITHLDDDSHPLPCKRMIIDYQEIVE